MNRLTFLTFGLVFVLSACSPAAQGTPDPQPVTMPVNSMVSATGVVVPEQEALLSVSAGGVVESVLVEKGDQVSTGQVLVRLEGTEQQAAAGCHWKRWQRTDSQRHYAGSQ